MFDTKDIAVKIVEAFTVLNCTADLEKFIKTEEGMRFLITDTEGASVVVERISTLASLLDQHLITTEGQLSEVYYAMGKTEGYRVKVFESDSFGPLVAGVRNNEHNYWVIFG